MLCGISVIDSIEWKCVSLDKVGIFINISLTLGFIYLGTKILVNDETAAISVHFYHRLKGHPIIKLLLQWRTSPNHNLEVLVRRGNLTVAAVVRRKRSFHRRAIRLAGERVGALGFWMVEVCCGLGVEDGSWSVVHLQIVEVDSVLDLSCRPTEG